MDTATTTADNSDAHAEDDLEKPQASAAGKRVQSAQAFGVDVSMLRCSSSDGTQEHVEMLKEAFDRLQAQVLALRIRGEETCLTCSIASDLALPRVRGEANDGGCVTQLSALCIGGEYFLGRSLLP